MAAKFLEEEESQLMERRLKERGTISSLEVEGKKNKEFKKMSKSLALRVQISKERLRVEYEGPE